MFKQYRIKRLEVYVAGLSAEYSEFVRVFTTVKTISQYHLDKMASLKKIIAEYEQTLEHLKS